MPQVIEFLDKDLEKVDALVKNGVFHDRESALKGILESLSESSLSEIKRVERAKHEASMFLEIYRGNMLYPDKAVKMIKDGKDVYKISVKSASFENSPILEYVYVDTETLEVELDLSTGFESLPETSEEELEIFKKVYETAGNYCERNLDGLYAGAPRVLDIEGEKEFEVIVKGRFNGKTWICGYIFIDFDALEVKEAAIDKKRIDKLRAGENINEGSLL